MKTLVFSVFAIFLSVAFAGIKEFAEEFKPMVKEVGNTCIKEVGATNDDLDALLTKREIPTKHEAMCLIYCLHKNWGIQNSEGKVDVEGATKSLAPLQEVDADLYNKAKSVVKTCTDTVANDPDPCVTATNLAKCGKEESKKLGIDEAYEI